MKRCPKCGGKNPADAWLCDCGYEFPGSTPAAEKSSGAGKGAVAKQIPKPGENTPSTVALLALCVLSAMIAGFLVPTSPRSPESAYPAMIVALLACVFFYFWLFRVIECIVRWIAILFFRWTTSRSISPLWFHTGCLIAAFAVMFDIFYYLKVQDPLTSHRSPSQLKTDLADRVPVNRPNGPKSYHDVISYMRADKLSDFDRHRGERLALREVVARARKAGDVHLLGALMESDDPSLGSRAAHALDGILLSSRTLSILTHDLGNNEDRPMQHNAIRLLNKIAHKTTRTSNRIPDFPDAAHFNQRPDYWVSLWSAWWESNKGEIQAKITAGDGR